LSHRFFNSYLKKNKNWVAVVGGVGPTHTNIQNKMAADHRVVTHTHMKKSSVGVAREKSKKKKPSTFFAQHCLVIRHVLS
jgi:hypothetical protein